MVATTAQNAQLLAPGLRTIFFNKYREVPPEYTKFLKSRTSKKNYETDYEMAGLGTMPTKDEGTPVQYADATPGTTKKYTHIAFGLGFRATEEAVEDDLYGPIRNMSSQLGIAARHVRDVRGATVLNSSFDNGVIGFKAALSLCNTAHTLLKGGTAANRPSTEAVLSMAALEAMILLFDGWVTEEGIPGIWTPKRLIVPPALQFTAEELLMSPQQPENANNARNPVYYRNIELVVLHYLTSTTAWWLQGDQHDMNFIVRRDIAFQSGDDFDTGDAKYKATQRFSYGFGDWRDIAGTTGT